MGGAADASTTARDPPLPNASREFGHVVNFVDVAVVAEVEAFLRADTAGTGLPISAKKFLQYYLDEYDFLFILTDHQVTDSTAVAAFSPVYRPANKATGDNLTTDHRLAHGSERLLGVIGAQTGAGIPPFEHELAHYWAAHLDSSLGFGKDAKTTYSGHWGMTSVNGQLGGFAATAFGCAQPAGAMPPNCTPAANGRYRYLFAPFLPYVNRNVNYAPLELYLMGLLPAAEVPARYLRIEGAAFDAFTIDSATNKYVLEADGTSEILFASVLQFHGEVQLLPTDRRQYTSAFMVVSAAPASDEVMTSVSEWQEIFGNTVPSRSQFRSFETCTGARAKLSTRLGRRRTPSDAIPNPPAPADCSVTKQDCPSGLACYSSTTRQCGVPGKLNPGAACTRNSDCLPGFACPNRLAKCAAYCDPFDATATKACATFCTAGYTQLLDSAGVLAGGYCQL